jgi:hypothetical protein
MNFSDEGNLAVMNKEMRKNLLAQLVVAVE